MTQTSKTPKRYVGTVKFFNDERGYGFIETPMDSDLRRDIFVHHTCIVMDGYRKLEQGQSVEFEAGEEARGPIALKVVVL